MERAGHFGASVERQHFVEHVAGFDVGHDEAVGLAFEGRVDAFYAECFGVAGCAEVQRSVEDEFAPFAFCGALAKGAVSQRVGKITG